MKAQVIGDIEVRKVIEKLRDVDVRDLNFQRGQVFQKFSQGLVASGGAGLKANSAATNRLQGKEHSPLYSFGGLLKKMKIYRNTDTSVDVGYRQSGSEKAPGTKITVAKLAVLQTTGFRVPLRGPRGERVRKWFMAHDIFFKKSRHFLQIRPRPFLHNSIKRYEDRKFDEKVIKRVIDTIFRKL